jgi:RNA polymerase sigma-70 factor (ECF subfamily)
MALAKCGGAQAVMGDQLKKITVERDAGAFRFLFLTFYPKVKAMLIRQGTDKDAAEEITQDTLLAVWRKSHQFSGDRGNVSAWIYAIARNLRIDRIRRQLVSQRVREEFETIERIRDSAQEPVSWEQRQGEIQRALGRLPQEQLQVLQLSFIDGLTQSEIAAWLAVPLGTVKSRMRLAFKKLRFATEREI